MPIPFSYSISPRRSRSVACLGFCTAIAVGPVEAWAASGHSDLAGLPMEQLLNLEVYSASKFVQKLSEAPSAASVVTATDIKTFGWRSLADILSSMRGLYVSNDRNYQYLGARGFLRPGDYNTRFLLLVDGYRSNDAVFDQASIGSEFMLDVDLIERVEFVPGPGSSIYGANAFFGVVNVITKGARDLNKAQVSAETGSAGARKLRASRGWKSEDGNELLLSATTYRSRGRDLYYPEYDTPETGNGVAQGLDFDRGQNVFIKAAAGPVSLSLAHGERKKGIPTASFSQVFNDPRSHTLDKQSFINAGYQTAIDDRTELSARLFWGRYDYSGDYVYDYPPVTLNRDGSRARWAGAEVKLLNHRFERHKLVMGAEYQRNYRQDQFNYDVEPNQVNLDNRNRGNRFGIYLQDEFALRKDLLLNAGVRYDHDSNIGGNVNPRVALIYKPASATVLKALYGKAYRAPNTYEMHYQFDGPGGQRANPDLRAEHIRTYELVLEHFLSADSRVTASVFRNSVTGLISQTVDPGIDAADTGDDMMTFQNVDKARARGFEVELERAWSSGAKLRTSYSWQQAHDAATGALLVNSPRHLAKLNLAAPLPGNTWRAGVEAQYVGSRATLAGRTGGYWLTNLTMFSEKLVKGMELSASVYNLFDRAYADPGSTEHAQDAIMQDGRSFRLKLAYAF